MMTFREDDISPLLPSILFDVKDCGAEGGPLLLVPGAHHPHTRLRGGLHPHHQGDESPTIQFSIQHLAGESLYLLIQTTAV
jgi:hypothetical protein